MANVSVVIGANFGDEGKGLMTDYLVSKAGSDSVVVRFNGGAQAGHTVETPEGQRHVFSHFGSGSFLGVTTHLSKDFISNPISFKKEREDLLKLQLDPIVNIDSRSIITTPWDMIYNQYIENSRGNDRHGSCGMGIFQTITRNKAINLTYSDLIAKSPDEYNIIIKDIIEYYVIKATKHNLGTECIDFIQSPNVLYKFKKDVEYFLYHTTPLGDKNVSMYNNIIFEGAQGLLLDQSNMEYFPHLTPSSTGMTNVLEVLEEADITDTIDIHYMTRAYLTRHGAGPMPNECDKPYDTIKDKTNLKNNFQGALRFGNLDTSFLLDTIKEDLEWVPLKHRPHLVVTCVDQVPEDVITQIREDCDNSIYVDSMYTSCGPTRNHVSKVIKVFS